MESSPVPTSIKHALFCTPIILGAAVPNLLIAQEQAIENITRLEHQIQNAESNQTSFDSSIGELSFGLGLQLSQIDKYEQALAAFQRADQNIKIREGLYSQSREPSMRKIYEQNLLLKDWDEAEVSLGAIAWLTARNSDLDSADNHLQVVQELVVWHLARDFYASREEGESELLKSRDYLEDLYEIIETQDLPLDQKTLELAIAVNHRLALRDEISPRIGYLDSEAQANLQKQVVEQGCQRHFGVDTNAISECSSTGRREITQNTRDLSYSIRYSQLVGNAEQSFFKTSYATLGSGSNSLEDHLSYEYEQNQRYFAGSYTRGKSLLETRLENVRQTNNNSAIIKARLDLADWHLLFGDAQSAEKNYFEAWQLAESSNLEAEINMLPPKPIAISGLIDEMPVLRSGSRKAIVDFEVTVHASGRVERIEVLQTNLHDLQPNPLSSAESDTNSNLAPSPITEAMAQLMAEISMMTFRPILREGVPIASVDYRLTRPLYY